MLAEVRGKSLNAWVLPIYNSTRLIPITTQLSQEQQPLTMTRAELIQQLALRHLQLTVQDCDLAARTILDAISHTLAKGGRIEIRDFGSFVLNYRPPRAGRNPKTGVSVRIPAKYTPHFKAGKELRERVDHT